MYVSRETIDERVVPALGAEITREATHIGLALPADTSDMLARHLLAVLSANRKLNLTSVPPEQAVRLHVIDSLTVLHALPESPRRMLDIGSGAGYPGIPVALVTGCSTVLLESRQRRAAFLRQVVEFLGVDRFLSVEEQRAESFARTGEQFDVVMARAVASLPSLLELAAPLLSEGGRFIAMKGPLASQEIERGRKVAEICGLSREETQQLALPGGGEERTLVIYERVTAASIALPRRDGMAQKRPLG